jgi:hypothetical protein
MDTGHTDHGIWPALDHKHLSVTALNQTARPRLVHRTEGGESQANYSYPLDVTASNAFRGTRQLGDASLQS